MAFKCVLEKYGFDEQWEERRVTESWRGDVQRAVERKEGDEEAIEMSARSSILAFHIASDGLPVYLKVCE